MSTENIELDLQNPNIVVAQWVPMGKNNLVSISRHIGAHKKYKAPTEFGMRGTVEDVASGSFSMLESGVFLNTVSSGFGDRIDLHLRTELNASKAVGISISKDGLVEMGITVPDTRLNPDEIKIILGKLTYRFVDHFYPILTDVQRDLLCTLYGVEDIMTSHFSIGSYALIQTDSLGEHIAFANSQEFLQKYPRKIEAITDWIVEDMTIENCHIFIGMRATVCVGAPSPALKQALQSLLFLKTMFNSSFRLFSLVWEFNKIVKNINRKIPNAGYKTLKEFNTDISKLSDKLSRLGVLDEMMGSAIDEQKEKWESMELRKNNVVLEDFDAQFDDEVEKADDRDLIMDQLQNDLESLGSTSEQRMDLIMTKNSEFLNLVLLVLTLISVIGIADVFGFGLQEWGLVILFMIPFFAASVVYFKNYLKNFAGKRRR